MWIFQIYDFFNRLRSHWWELNKDKMEMNRHFLLSPISSLYAGLQSVFSCICGSIVGRVRGVAILKT